MHHDDFNFEPVRGLPEALPEDEHILWQGRPDGLRLAKEAWGLNWVLAYFAALAEFVCDGLDTCGYFYCPGDMMASNPRWRQPLRVWQGYFGWYLQGCVNRRNQSAESDLTGKNKQGRFLRGG